MWNKKCLQVRIIYVILDLDKVRSVFMKKYKDMFILGSFLVIILILLVILVYFKRSNILHKEEISLDKIKEQLVNTQEIYICNYSENISTPCHRTDLIRIENDKQVIKDFIDILITLEEFDGPINKMKDNHTLYFVDDNSEVIVSAEFGYHFILKTKNKEYTLDLSFNEKLRELLNFDF